MLVGLKLRRGIEWKTRGSRGIFGDEVLHGAVNLKAMTMAVVSLRS